MPTEDAYSSGHLVLSHFGTCMCSNVETNLSWTCLVSGLLNFEHPSVLLFCLVRSVIFRITPTSGLLNGQICRQFWHAFSVNSGVILKKYFCISILCYVSERCIKDFNGSKRQFLTFLYSVSHKSNASKFWQLVCKFISIRLIQWFYENGRSIDKIYALKQQFWIWYY